jgi:acyl carrier protein
MTPNGSSSPSSASTARPSIEDVKDTLRRLIEENAGLPADVIQDDATVDGDLAMDSMSLISLQVAVEETFDISFAPEDLQARNRFDAIAALILERVRARL